MKVTKGNLIANFLNLWIKTLRIRVEFERDVKFPAIFVFWHGRMFLLPFVFKNYGKKVHVLISRHRDGELAAEVIKRLGFNTVRGSTGVKKGGGTAFLRMLDILKEGEGVAITPDGPKGPPERVKMGVAKLSIKANVPIYPISFSAKPSFKLNSWDSFFVPFPFSKSLVKVGAPIFPKGLKEEELAKKVEFELKRITKECDREV